MRFNFFSQFLVLITICSIALGLSAAEAQSSVEEQSVEEEKVIAIQKLYREIRSLNNIVKENNSYLNLISPELKIENTQLDNILDSLGDLNISILEELEGLHDELIKVNSKQAFYSDSIKSLVFLFTIIISITIFLLGIIIRNNNEKEIKAGLEPMLTKLQAQTERIEKNEELINIRIEDFTSRLTKSVEARHEELVKLVHKENDDILKRIRETKEIQNNQLEEYKDDLSNSVDLFKNEINKIVTTQVESTKENIEKGEDNYKRFLLEASEKFEQIELSLNQFENAIGERLNKEKLSISKDLFFKQASIDRAMATILRNTDNTLGALMWTLRSLTAIKKYFELGEMKPGDTYKSMIESIFNMSKEITTSGEFSETIWGYREEINVCLDLLLSYPENEYCYEELEKVQKALNKYIWTNVDLEEDNLVEDSDANGQIPGIEGGE